MSLKIAYTFIAEDRFSKAVAKMAQEAKRLQKTMGNVNKASQGTTKQTKAVKEAVDKVTPAMKKINAQVETYRKKLGETTKPTQGFINRLKKAHEQFNQFGQAVTKMSDKFGMGAYFRMMNIAIPMAIVAKFGMDYAESLNRANANMKSLFGSSKKQMNVVKSIGAESAKLGSKFGYTKADIMSGASIMASGTANILAAKATIPAMVTFARSQGVSLQQAAHTVLAAMRSGKIEGTPIRYLYGTQQQRFTQTLTQIQQMYGKGAQSLIKTTPVQIDRITSSLKEIAGTIITGLLPAFTKFADVLSKITPPIVHFIQVHKTLMKVLGFVAIGVLGYLGVLVTLGAVVGALGAPIEAIVGILRMFTVLNMVATLFKIFRTAVLAASIALDVNPIGLVITALAALGVALFEVYKHWDQVKEATDEAYRAATKFASLAILHPVTTLKETGHFFAQPFEDIWARHHQAGATHAGKSGQVNIHVHDKGGVVSHVDSKSGDNPITTLLYGHHLGSNMVSP